MYICDIWFTEPEVTDLIYQLTDILEDSQKLLIKYVNECGILDNKMYEDIENLKYKINALPL